MCVCDTWAVQRSILRYHLVDTITRHVLSILPSWILIGPYLGFLTQKWQIFTTFVFRAALC